MHRSGIRVRQRIRPSPPSTSTYTARVSSTVDSKRSNPPRHIDTMHHSSLLVGALLTRNPSSLSLASPATVSEDPESHRSSQRSTGELSDEPPPPSVCVTEASDSERGRCEGDAARKALS